MGVRSYPWLTMALVVTLAGCCHGHGRLIDPPSRASAWRFGFMTPKDYNDNEGFCGGFAYQYQVQGGKCGLCGDAWDENPRPHEAGGLYATGTIVRTYNEGQVITVSVEITANHQGYFEFRICPNNNPSVKASQTCLNDHPLFAADGSGFHHYIDTHQGVHQVKLKLPEGLTCTQCVFQWRYVAGNNWGTCEDGTQQLGCGPQEEFRACADVAITGTNGGQSVTTTSTPTSGETDAIVTEQSSTNPTTSVTDGSGGGGSITNTAITEGGSGNCRAVGVWQTIPGMDAWCVTNCNHTPPYCPASHCTCT